MMARVKDNGVISEVFAVINGVEQSCVLAPTLLDLIFTSMLMEDYSGELPGIRIAYKTNGPLISGRHMQAPTRPKSTTCSSPTPAGSTRRPKRSGKRLRIWCSCRQSNYVGETGRLLRTRIAKHAAAVRRNGANSQVAAHSTRPGRTFKFDEAEIPARGDNRVSRELLESCFTGPQSIN
ncbi:hypothetical protein SprV_0301296000 [Sparganum proliferum]